METSFIWGQGNQKPETQHQVTLPANWAQSLDAREQSSYFLTCIRDSLLTTDSGSDISILR